MDLTCTHLFPTPIFAIRFPDHGPLNAELLARIQERRASDPGVRLSNPLGWHSSGDLFADAGFAEIASRVTAVVEAAARAMGHGGVRLRRASSWVAVNPKHAGHQAHEHPNALLSGAYYVKVPRPTTGLTFHDPRPAKVFFKPLVETETLFTAEAVTYAVEEGLLLVFPAWLRHGTDPNPADEERIALSFNFAFQ